MNFLKLGKIVKSTNCSLSGNANGQKSVQWFSTSVFNNKLASQDQKDIRWNKAISEAEKVVGYPTSFLSLRWLLNDEVANVAGHLRKLIGSNHPLLKTAKSLLYNERNNMQAWGLIVLLISKAAGPTSTIPEMEQDKSVGILYSQRALAEISEMMHTSAIIHRALVNLQGTEVLQKDELNDMLFGNKIALLGGDYLLCNSCVELSNLNNSYITEVISASLRDQCEGEFVGPRDEQNNPLPSRPNAEKTYIGTIGDSGADPLAVVDALGNAQAEWTGRHVLRAASLLGHSCQSALRLAGHPPEFQAQAYGFGKHLALTWQACLDLEPFKKPFIKPFSLISAPLLFHLEHDPSLYSEIEKGFESIKNIDYDLLHDAILSGPGIEKTKELRKEHSQAALEFLLKFSESDARKALTNMIVAMQEPE